MARNARSKETSEEEFTDDNTSENISDGGGSDNGTIAEPVKRRGRPKLSEEEKERRKQERENNTETSTKRVSGFSFVSPDKPRVGRPPKQKVQRTQEEADKITEETISFIESIAVEILGEEGKFKTHEKLILYYSLPKYLQSTDLAAIERFNNIIIPLSLLLVIAMYGIRVFTIYATRVQEEKEKQAQLNNQFTQTQEQTVNQSNYYDATKPLNEVDVILDETQSEDTIRWNNPPLATSTPI